MYGYIDLPTIKDGTNCRSCGMRRSDCEFADEGEVDVRCCDTCNHPDGDRPKTPGEGLSFAEAMGWLLPPEVSL
jgi:hypothetical protein